jgi:hypothetical protein
MLSIRTLADDEAPQSMSNRLRASRFRVFESLARGFKHPLRILDIGGTNEFWEHRGWAGRDDVEIRLLNLGPQQQRHHNLVPAQGEATNLSEYTDNSFDIAFSNSVIEHLFTLAHQRAMAREVKRVGRAFFVQTPNYWFPVEPHFHWIGWQWYPLKMRAAIIQRRTCGWRGRCPDWERALQVVSEVRLLTRRELNGLFPGATIVAEKFLGMNKSWMVYGGFPLPK